jgi:ABC-type uncharacterized transport system substrate-binding protein
MVPRPLVLLVMALLAGHPPVMAEHAGAPVEVTVVEWLPLTLHAQILRSFEQAVPEFPPLKEGVRIKTVAAYADDAELDAQLQKTGEEDIVIAFGDHAAQRARALLPGRVVVALLARLTAAEPATLAPPATVLDSGPGAEELLQLARQLRPRLKSLGVIYTRDFQPNQMLLESLSRQALPEVAVHPVLVDPGFCRTESDFSRAVEAACAEQVLDVLFVPEDPNCARFGRTIFTTAARAGVATVGTQETEGQGGDAVLRVDAAAMGRELARVLASLVESGRLAAASSAVPRVVALREGAGQ